MAKTPFVVNLAIHFDTARERDEWLRDNAAGLADSALDAETLRLALRAQGLGDGHKPSSRKVGGGHDE